MHVRQQLTGHQEALDKILHKWKMQKAEETKIRQINFQLKKATSSNFASQCLKVS
jgi:hypothetical protein